MGIAVFSRRKGAPTRSAASETPTKGHHKTAPGRRPISGRSCQALLLWFKSRKTAQVGRFSESRPDALASFKLSSWPVYGPLVVPRSVLPLLQVGLVGFPASFQSSDSIIGGQRVCNPPATRNSPWAGRKRPGPTRRAGNLLDARCQDRKGRCRQGPKNREGQSPTPGWPAFRLLPTGPRQPAGLTARRASALILGWGALDEGENQASDGRFDGRGTLQEKFHWRPVAPTSLLAPSPAGRGPG